MVLVLEAAGLYSSSICYLMSVGWCYLTGFCKLPDGSDWWWVELGLSLVGRDMLSKTLVYLSADAWGCAPSLLFGLWWPSLGVYRLSGRINGNDLQQGSFQWVLPRAAAASGLIHALGHYHPTSLQETLQQWQVGLVQSPVGSLLLSPGSWYT